MNKTAISWATHTWNPISGCTKISPGCANCYAEAIALRFRHGPAYLPGVTEIRTHLDRLDQPRSIRQPSLIFTCSVSDIFHEDVPAAFLEEVFGVMEACHQHQFLLLTKRAERMKEILTRPSWRWPLPNVWLGVSAENQRMADLRIPLLLDVDAAIHYVSAEPLLRSLDLARWMRCQICGGPKDDHTHPGALLPASQCLPGGDHPYVGVDWLIVGGESGVKARPMHPEWAESLALQAVEAGIAFHFKQWGAWASWGVRGATRVITEAGYLRNQGAIAHDGDALVRRTGRSAEQQVLLGMKHQAWPPYQRAML